MLSLKKWEEFLKRQISAFSSSVGVTSWWWGGTKRGRRLPSKAFQRGLSHTGGACPPPASGKRGCGPHSPQTLLFRKGFSFCPWRV